MTIDLLMAETLYVFRGSFSEVLVNFEFWQYKVISKYTNLLISSETMESKIDCLLACLLRILFFLVSVDQWVLSIHKALFYWVLIYLRFKLKQGVTFLIGCYFCFPSLVIHVKDSGALWWRPTTTENSWKDLLR